ncbi:hypothetical protein [Edwardsiella tarda]|uniref:hypothetical protein n=1 Tax=Edwardsiella tarda TaxID=636 RepID=UPI00063BF099|nr:hypothetical protein [Edwardsiella tarda]AKH89016.1 hypothetical protein AAW15_07640 [Edwardsiella tarda]
MNVRKDFEDVSSHISRLLSFSRKFYENDSYWSHLKNKEDFKFISRIPCTERYKVELLYSTGRDMALYMADTLGEINYDVSKFPTLTSVVEGFDNSWVYGNYLEDIPDMAIQVCEEYGVNLWSVKQMYDLFKKQEKLLSAIRITLNMLKHSNLYKLEKGIEIVSDKHQVISINEVSHASININSANASATISQVYNEPSVFAEIMKTIKSSGFDGQIEKELIDNTQALIDAHKCGGFSAAYKDFMQNISAHITVFAPFLSGLTALLP